MTKGKLSIMFMLMILQGTAVMLWCNWYVQIHPCTSGTFNSQVHVLLLSSWRSGSSFLGQAFNQHPSVFYLKEPARHTWTGLKQYGATRLRLAVRDLLRSAFHCDLSEMEAYKPGNKKVSALYMWTESQALCSPPLCPLMPPDQVGNLSLCSKLCRRTLLSEAEKTCRNYSHVVLKEVRVFELESLYSLLRDPSLDLRIIHLVRDPRAMARSQARVAKDLEMGVNILLNHEPTSNNKKLPHLKKNVRALSKICNSHVRIIKAGLQNPPSFLKGRYKLIRYEDMVDNPLKEISMLYEFVGLEMTRELGDWILRLTQAERGKGGGFRIDSRNAKVISQKWRYAMRYRDVTHVQNVCKQAMSVLGYREVNSTKQQRDAKQDLLLPLKLQSVDQQDEGNFYNQLQEDLHKLTKMDAQKTNTL